MYKYLLLGEVGQHETSRTTMLIDDLFAEMDKKGWKRAFSTEGDYHDLRNLLKLFFEHKPYNLPKTQIPVRIGSKTKLGATLGLIHKELLNESTLKSDTKFFELVRVLEPFAVLDFEKLYGIITRHRKK